MNKKPQSSVRQFLLISIIIALLSVSLVSGAISWFNTKQELDELYDQNLRQIANVIDAQHTIMATASQYSATDTESKIKGEEDYFVRIRNLEGKTLYASHPSIKLTKINREGFSILQFQNIEWKLFVKKSKAGDDFIDVAQVHKYRIKTIGEIAYGLLIPQLLSIPLLGILIWLVVGKGLLPLETLSYSIANRKEALLTPISLDKAPVEIQPLVSALNGLLLRLDGMVKVLRRFTADAAHELRTPLTALKLQLSVLEKAKNPEEQKQAVDHLKAGVERSIALVQQLLTLARTEPGTTDAPFADVNLLDVAKSAIVQFIDVASKKKLDLGIVKGGDILVKGNKDALETLLNNIIDNAIRYTPEDGIIDIKIEKTIDGAVLEVSDTGPGIPDSEMMRVFDRFYRGKGVAAPGTGLGLAIVKEIAERHGARIVLDRSEELLGLSFKIVFLVL